jgi:hypothetical protein
LLSNYSGVIEIGLVENIDIIQNLSLQPYTFSRPEEELVLAVPSLSDLNLDKLLFTPFVHTNNTELFCVNSAPFCLQVVLDARDPIQLKHTFDRLQLVHDVFGDNLSLHYCDWFTCPDVVDAVGLATFLNPLFVLRAVDHYEPFRKRSLDTAEVSNWLRKVILHETLPGEKDQPPIPRLTADSFISIALNPDIDVVLLVGTPDMPFYEESEQNMRMLIECFQDFPTVQFYEFNIKTERLPGLEMPESDKPLLSVWPATKDSRGSTFGAYLSIPIVLDNLLKLIVTQVSDPELEVMAGRIQRILEEGN